MANATGEALVEATGPGLRMDENSEGGVSLVALILPPFVVSFAILAIMMSLWLSTNQLSRQGRSNAVASGQEKQGSTLSMTKQSLESMVLSSQNKLFPLLKISMPCIMSILFCPVMLLYAPPMIAKWWPNGLENINDALSVFLVPASLLYALLFTLSFEFVYEKQTEIRTALNKEVNLMFELLNLTHNFSRPRRKKYLASMEARLEIARLIHRQSVDLVSQLSLRGDQKDPDRRFSILSRPARSKLSPLPDVQPDVYAVQVESSVEELRGDDNVERERLLSVRAINQDYARKLWMLLPAMKTLVDGDIIDNILLSKATDSVMDFSDVVAQRRALLSQRMNIFQWAFLQVLGYISFLAVLLIKADSPHFEVTMCMLTAFSISILTLVIADADEPFHGFFRVRIDSLVSLVQCSATECRWLWATVSSLHEKRKNPSCIADLADALASAGTQLINAHRAADAEDTAQQKGIADGSGSGSESTGDGQGDSCDEGGEAGESPQQEAGGAASAGPASRESSPEGSPSAATPRSAKHVLPPIKVPIPSQADPMADFKAAAKGPQQGKKKARLAPHSKSNVDLF